MSETGTAGRKTLAERIADLTPEQRALYELKTREFSRRKGERRVRPRSDPKPWPASTDQTALWVIQQLDPTTSAYNIGNGYRVFGSLDVALLQRCLNLLTERHHILRTTFTAIDARPYQVLSERSFTVPVIDLRFESDPEAAAQDRAAALIREPFDLEKGPLLRLPLIRITDSEWFLIGVFHHIITDWWSYHLFFTELFTLYTGFALDRPALLPELPIQYADWAAWRDQWEQSSTFAQQENYWLRKLAGVPHLLEVPCDRPHPAIQSHAGAREFFQISPALAENVRKMSSRAGVSSFMTFLAGLNAFLFRYTGQEEFLVGTPVSADRDLPETANLIGYMLNILLLRADVTGNPSFLQVLERVRKTCIEAFAHKEFPFRRLVERLKPERQTGRMPLYQIEYVYTSAENPVQQNWLHFEGAAELYGCDIHPLSIDRKSSPVDLQIAFTGARKEFSLMIEYNTDVFGPATIRRFGQQMIYFLDNALSEAELQVSLIPLLDVKEKALLLDTFNTAFRPVPEATIIDLLQRQVAVSSHSVALITGMQSFTYQELNERSNRLAHYLIQSGFGPEDIIGLCLPRSAEMLIAILAVLKSGAAYLPLDPEYPPHHLQQMISDARPRLLLTTQTLAKQFSCVSATLPVDEPEVQDHIAAASSHNPLDSDRSSPLLPGNAAYVIYTSGSTGAPKGVVGEHRNLASFSEWAGTAFAPRQWAGVLASTSICFDMSIFELLVTLVHGGTVILAGSALELNKLPAKEQVCLINTVPSAAEFLLDSNSLPSTLEVINLGGEALPGTLVRRLHHRRHLAAVYNLYGPTEATIYSTYALCPAVSEKTPAIGAPLSNTRAYVLDGRFELVPVGVVGELYIGGMGVSRGYLSCPDLTARRFLPDPYAALPGTRMYRTGDLTRWRDDGQLEFIGRIDRQLKLRGFRIEPAEVEAALLANPGIRQAVVMAASGLGEGPQLFAYVVPLAGAELDPAGIRSWLAERLPAHLVPAGVITLPALPLRANGKLDASALPVPSRQPSVYRAPRSAREKVLARILSQVLSIDPIGLDDNFFYLGGDSISSLQVVARARREGLGLTSRDIFQQKTIEDLASVAAALQPE